MSELRKLPAAQVHVSASTHPAAGAAGADAVTDVTITNTSSGSAAAFFLRADLRRGTSSGVLANGETVVRPVFWSQNDVTLWPGESETLHVTYRRADLAGSSPVVTVSGWNVAPVDASAG